MSVATIGSALAEKRREFGLEKGQAADKIGMSRTTYSSYEQDAQRPSVDVFPALAQFLEVSMEELLTLYGATCVAAVRPSLERLLSDRGDDEQATPAVDSPSPDLEAEPIEVVLELQEVAREPSTQENSPPSSSGAVELNEVVLELEEVAAETDTQEQESQSAGSEAESEVVLELREDVTESDSEQNVTTTPSELEGEGEAVGELGSSEPTESFQAPSHVEEPPVPESVVFEPSPYFIRTSMSESSPKNSERKKKKKKKKKK
jgi:transcriptional regulator with XRE-family HTH domain